MHAEDDEQRNGWNQKNHDDGNHRFRHNRNAGLPLRHRDNLLIRQRHVRAARDTAAGDKVECNRCAIVADVGHCAHNFARADGCGKIARVGDGNEVAQVFGQVVDALLRRTEFCKGGLRGILRLAQERQLPLIRVVNFIRAGVNADGVQVVQLGNRDVLILAEAIRHQLLRVRPDTVLAGVHDHGNQVNAVQ